MVNMRFHQDPQCFFKSAFRVVSPLPGLLSEVYKQAFLGVELQEALTAPFFQPVQVPLNSSTTIGMYRLIHTQQSH